MLIEAVAKLQMLVLKKCLQLKRQAHCQTIECSDKATLTSHATITETWPRNQMRLKPLEELLDAITSRDRGRQRAERYRIDGKTEEIK